MKNPLKIGKFTKKFVKNNIISTKLLKKIGKNRNFIENSLKLENSLKIP